MGGKIFISYRRAEDSGATAGRLRDRLEKDFGRDQLFMDVVDIPVGVDFKVHLNSKLAECDVVLVVIGSKWLWAKEKARLHQPDDVVAFEIAVALERNIPVIPVLVDGARIPNASDLPDPLKQLTGRQAVEVRNAYLDSDVGALVARMRETVPALLDRAEPHPAGPVRTNASTTNDGSILGLGRKLLETAISSLSTEKLKGWKWIIGFLAAVALFLLLWIFGGDVPKRFIDSSLEQAGTAGRAVETAVQRLHLSPSKFRVPP